MFRWIVAFIAVIVLGILAWQITRPPESGNFEAQIIAPDAALPNLGFERVGEAYRWDFPADYQPHPDYQYERWQLDLGDCVEQSAAITFDRIGLVSEQFAPDRPSDWAFRQVMIAEVDLPDLETTHYGRMALGLAGAEAGRVWLGGWSLAWEDDAYHLMLDDRAGTFTVQDAPVTSSTGSYHRLQLDLTGRFDGVSCDAVLVHTFGEALP